MKSYWIDYNTFHFSTPPEITPFEEVYMIAVTKLTEAAQKVFSNHRLALLPSALLVEPLLRCQLGLLN